MSHSHHWAAKFRRPPQGRAAARFYCRHRQNGPRRGELERWDMDGSTCICIYIYIDVYRSPYMSTPFWLPNGVQEVERLSEQRDIMMQKAQGSEAALDSERQVWSSSHATVGLLGPLKIHHVSPEPAAWGLRLLAPRVPRNKNSGTNKGLIQQTRGPAIRGGTCHSPRMRDLQKLMIDHHSPQHLLGPEMWVSTCQIWWCMSHPAVSSQAIDDLERECHSLELRCCNAKEEVGRDRDRSRFVGYGSQEDFSCKTLGTQWDSTNIFCHLKALESTKELLIPTR